MLLGLRFVFSSIMYIYLYTNLPESFYLNNKTRLSKVKFALKLRVEIKNVFILIVIAVSEIKGLLQMILFFLHSYILNGIYEYL